MTAPERATRPRLRRLLRSGPLLTVLLLAAVGCGDQQVGEPEARPQSTSFELAIDDGFQYEPPVLTVQRGAVIDVANRADSAHSVTSSKAAPVAFDTGLMAAGDTAELRLDTPGRYPYYCRLHRDIHKGLIIVE